MDDVADLYQIVSGWESEIKDDRRMLLSEKHKKANRAAVNFKSTTQHIAVTCL